MIKIKIDNKEYQAEAGKTILEVAMANGIIIPTMCHHKELSKTTSCFVCVVKNVKTGRYMPSCSALAEDGMELLSEDAEVKDMRKTALELLLSEHSGDCEAPCTVACPAHAKVEEYVRAGKEGRHLDGLKIIKERIPLPNSIGRVCPRFCEKDCRRNVIDKPVAINDFKRLAADLHYDEYIEECQPLNGKKVAIIGAGPAGYAVAYYLRLEGIASDLYDKMPKPGGMLRYGIPEYRLPKKILDKELAHFEKLGGITVFTEKELGKNLDLEELKKDYDAIAVTIGSWKSSSARIEGEEYAVSGIKWLEEIALANWDKPEYNPGKTIVIGGGNTAMDCLRTSVRQGSNDVNCFYRRTEKEMPAEQIEIDEAKEEGVNFHFLTAPQSLREENGKKILTCLKMELGEPDASGRRRPIPIEGSEFEIEADTVIAAIGQKTAAPKSLTTNKWGDIAVDDQKLKMENSEKIFFAGDCVTGPATVVEAVAGGRIVALNIKAFLEGSKYTQDYVINVSRGHWNHLKQEELVFLNKDLSKDNRVSQRLLSLDERKTTFKEVAFTYTKEEIRKEGERCIECSCTSKEDCRLKSQSEAYGAQTDKFTGIEKLPSAKYDNRHPSIIMDAGKCVKCGICVKTCAEVVNENLLGFKHRGYSTIMGTAFNQVLPNSCTDCGKCLDNCPTGALDWKKK